MSRMASAHDVAARVRDLPALPAAVGQLIASLDDDDLGTEQLAAVLSQDQALLAKTLRLANSSFYGMSRRVVTAADAMAILGLRTVRSVALAAGLARSFAPPRCAGFDFVAFWRHAIGTALCARALAASQRIDGGTAFALGLLHDIGALALASCCAEPYAAVLQYQRERDDLLTDAERAVLGTDHAELGALIAEQWRFAPAMVAAIAAHHAPAETAPDAAAGLIELVHVADNMAHALDLARRADAMVPPLAMHAWLRLGLDEATCLPLLARVESEHDALCAALLA